MPSAHVGEKPRLLHILGLLLALGALYLLISSNDLSAVPSLIARINPLGLFLVFLIYPVTIILDAVATRRLLQTDASLISIIKTRLLTEPANLLPGGSVAADISRPFLLEQHAQVTLTNAISATAARKLLILKSHAISIIFASVIGYPILESVLPGLGLIIPCLASIALVLIFAASCALYSSTGADRLMRMLLKLPSKRARAWIESNRSGFYDTSSNLAELSKSRPDVLVALAAYVGVWMLEATELVTIGYALSVELPFAKVYLADTVSSFFRGALVFIPAGAGVQELGYSTLLSGGGITVVLIATLALLRRTRELIWASIGCLLFGMIRLANRPSQKQKGTRHEPVPSAVFEY